MSIQTILVIAGSGSLGVPAVRRRHADGYCARILVEKDSPEKVLEDMIKFRLPYQTFYYRFDNSLPSG